ncbi:hypothetical protein SAMN05428939_7695 [Streptomyces sp. TLI_105]|nr:hypothetical protein SAMN05428939_7695 [Streptomyces sp. TLI_105]
MKRGGDTRLGGRRRRAEGGRRVLPTRPVGYGRLDRRRGRGDRGALDIRPYGRRRRVLLHPVLDGARSRVLRRRGRLGPVAGLPVHPAHGQTAADERDGGRHHGPALVLPPAGTLATPRRPPLRRRRHVHELRRCAAPRGSLKDGTYGYLVEKSAVMPCTRGKSARRGHLPRRRCGHRGGDDATAGGGRSDVRGIGAASRAHQGAVEMSAARRAVVHLRLSGSTGLPPTRRACGPVTFANGFERSATLTKLSKDCAQPV